MSWNRDHVLELDEDSLAKVEGIKALQQLKDDLVSGFMARAVLAEAGVRKEKAEIESAPLITTEGNLRPRMVVSSDSFHFWGQKLGYDCWNDQTFLREYERDNECSRINQKMAKTTILNQWGGAAA